jgi:hypothetical protein
VGLNGPEFGVAGHNPGIGSLCQSNAEGVRVRNGISSFDVSRGKYERPVYRHNPQRKLIDKSGCALGVLQALFTLYHVQAFAVVD